MSWGWVTGGVFGKNILLRCIVNTGVNMHTAAGMLAKGLAMKSGAKTVFSSNALDNSAQQYRVVPCEDGIALVMGVYLPLTWRKFTVDRREGYALNLTGYAYIIEKAITIKEVVRHAILNALLNPLSSWNIAF